MNPKQFLIWGGLVLVLVAILGFLGVIGPTAEASLFGTTWYFDDYENWAHLVLGVVALIAAFVFPAGAQKPLVLVVGVLALLFALYSLFISEDFYGAMLQNPADTILHFVVAIWAIWAGMRGAPALAGSAGPSSTGSGYSPSAGPSSSPSASPAQPTQPTSGGPQQPSA